MVPAAPVISTVRRTGCVPVRCDPTGLSLATQYRGVHRRRL